MKEKVYLDNAATTEVDARVLEAMVPYLKQQYGNPSAHHSLGRQTRMAIEDARRKIASLLRVRPKCIVFTSGGTESNNMAIRTALKDFGCRHVITSQIEHHAVLNPVAFYANEMYAGVSFTELRDDGTLNYNDLRRLLQQHADEGKKCLVTLMNANNEIGHLSDVRRIGKLCQKYEAIFHSDCVQTIGHYPVYPSLEGMHMASASAHKFHGPKGAGFLYINEDLHPSPLLYGGGQEGGRRSGTENVAAIVGMAEALSIAHDLYAVEQLRIHDLKQGLLSELKANFLGILANNSSDSLYSLLSVSFPKTEKSESLLFHLDEAGICVAGGSACSGGNSHVLKTIGRANDYVTVRFSFGRYNTKDEVIHVVEVLKEIMQLTIVSGSI